MWVKVIQDHWKYHLNAMMLDTYTISVTMIVVVTYIVKSKQFTYCGLQFVMWHALMTDDILVDLECCPLRNGELVESDEVLWADGWDCKASEGKTVASFSNW